MKILTVKNIKRVKSDDPEKQQVLITTQYEGRKDETEYLRKCLPIKNDSYLILIKNYFITCKFDSENIAYNIKLVGKRKKENLNIKVVLNESENEMEDEPKNEDSKPKQEENKAGVIHHEKYEQLKVCIENNIPLYVAGPAGSGKNFTLEQIANDLGINFYFSNSVQQEYKLTGFIDAGGKYHETEFYKACKEAESGKDCIFFLDEMDASIPEVLVLLNAAIANGYFEFPNGKIKFGNKVHFVAAGNTVGSGADEMYTGRMVLDQATLDRFAIIDFNYSLNIEMEISNHNSDLVSFIHSLRQDAESKGIRSTFSYRCITMVTQLEGKMDLKEILKIAVFKGMDSDTINTFSYDVRNKYGRALKDLRDAL